MNTLPDVDPALLTKFLVELLKSPSPTGFAHEAIALTEHVFHNLPGVQTKRLPRGALLVTVKGEADDAPRGLTAHADTLGAMVKAIKPNGRLQITKIGGVIWNTVETEGCTIYTRAGKRIRGSIMVTTASIHVNAEKLAETPRKEENMEVRLDERVFSAEDTRKLGIEVGDFVSFDPRVELTNGFVRSRHLDDKACVACMLAAVKVLQTAGLQPAQTTTLHISNYEEVGHGAASGFPPDLAELVTVDMAA
ncbi:MAG: M42 family metallopeptidase, partial [Burkholderiaceae bacterium]|nr:M42 family metallopeptidase [Burkholderiaceae bacterium]